MDQTQAEYIKEFVMLLNKLADLQLEYAEICELQALEISENILAH